MYERSLFLDQFWNPRSKRERQSTNFFSPQQQNNAVALRLCIFCEALNYRKMIKKSFKKSKLPPIYGIISSKSCPSPYAANDVNINSNVIHTNIVHMQQ